MLIKKEVNTAYLEDWPLHYYDIKDVNERERCLKKVLEEKPTSKEDAQRLQLLHYRYGELMQEKRADKFMRAWLLSKALTTENIHFFNKKRIEKEFRQYLKDLCVLEYDRNPILLDEWKSFAKEMIFMCCDSSSYKQIAVGLGHVSDKNVAMRIAGDIDDITKKLPTYFSLEEECKELHEIMKQSYIELLENGEIYWDYYCTNLR